MLTIPPEHDGRRLDQALAALLPEYSRSQLKAWILAGRVQLEGAAATPRSRVAAGQRVAVEATEAPDVEAVAAQPVDFRVLHEDEVLMVVDKPAGLVVHPGAGNPDATLENGLRHLVPALAELPRSGLLHRLDKDTSGLLLVAKTAAAYGQLQRELRGQRIRREYRAIVQGVVTAGGEVDAPLGRHPTQRLRMAVVADGREARTHYRVLARFAAHSFLALRLETGRTHQIRVHMAHLGFPVLGDPLYGGRPRPPAGAGAALIDALRGLRRQALHASLLGFHHPQTGAWLELASPLPADLCAVLAALAGSAEAATRLAALEWPQPR